MRTCKVSGNDLINKHADFSINMSYRLLYANSIYGKRPLELIKYPAKPPKFLSFF